MGLVNSLTHLGEAKEGDSSINVWWLGPFQLTAWGENWHKNHHTHAGSARLGLRWYQTDIGWYFIWMLKAIILASRTPSSAPAPRNWSCCVRRRPMFP